MKVFKKDGMLTKPAEKEVRRARPGGIGVEFETIIYPRKKFDPCSTHTKFRIMEDGSIQTFRFPFRDFNRKDLGEWIECAKPPQGDITQ